MTNALSRMQNLLRGLVSRWVTRREQQNPEVVYEAAIEERRAQYERLRHAAAGVLYACGKLGRELERRERELAYVRRELDGALERDDDELGVALVARRRALEAEVERLSAEHAELEIEAESAKRTLAAFHEQTLRLREEKARVLVRLASAKARLKLQETLGGLSPDADVRALESVREHVHQLVAEARLAGELRGAGPLEASAPSGTDPLRARIVGGDEDLAAARRELADLKRRRLAHVDGRALAADAAAAASGVSQPVPVPHSGLAPIATPAC